MEYRLGNYEEALAAAEAGLQVSLAIGDPFFDLILYSNMAEFALLLERYDAAVEMAEAALLIGREQPGDQYREEMLFALIYCGDSQRNLGQLTAAEASLQEALALATALDQPAGRLQATAALARLAETRGDATGLAEAVEHAGAIFEQLQHDANASYLATVPLDVPVTCYEVLQRAGDDRAQVVLRQAQQALAAMAEDFADEETRRAFLQTDRMLRANAV